MLVKWTPVNLPLSNRIDLQVSMAVERLFCCKWINLGEYGQSVIAAYGVIIEPQQNEAIKTVCLFYGTCRIYEEG